MGAAECSALGEEEVKELGPVEEGAVYGTRTDLARRDAGDKERKALVVV
jgi:hypothetical protein